MFSEGRLVTGEELRLTRCVVQDCDVSQEEICDGGSWQLLQFYQKDDLAQQQLRNQKKYSDGKSPQN
jgi:hypothetical protein